VAPRIPLPSDQLTFLGTPDTSSLCPDLNQAVGRYYTEIVTLGGVNPVTTELVRMRNAERQACNL
jgi:hypothetical protein